MAEFPRVLPTAEPFFFPGNRTGCLLIHGFTGTPKEMRWLGEYLNQKSFSVIAPRIAGHATYLNDIERSRWQDWVSSVEDAFYLIRPQVDQLFVIGLSMGGILASICSSYLKFEGLVTISTPYEIPQKDWRLKFIKPLAYLMPRVKKGPGDWHNIDAAKDHVDYPSQPTKSIIELLSLFDELHLALPKLNLPSLHIHSSLDKDVPFSHLQQIYDNNGSKEKSTFEVNKSGHVVIREPDRFIVFERIFEFISVIL